MTPRNRALGFVLLLASASCASSGTVAGDGMQPAGEESVPAAGTSVDATARSGGAVASGPASGEAAGAASAAVLGFTDGQADRGRDTFRGNCTECHYSGEFSDSQFKFKWSRRTAGDLYQFIQTSMPETAPGSLAPEEATDLVAYILRMNGFDPGSTELSADPKVLDAISLASIRQ